VLTSPGLAGLVSSSEKTFAGEDLVSDKFIVERATIDPSLGSQTRPDPSLVASGVWSVST
jgi:hypothetical protein